MAADRECPPVDTVKTDRGDAERLARLLRIAEVLAVRVPTETQEAARNLLRTHHGARDAMRARHRCEPDATSSSGITL